MAKRFVRKSLELTQRQWDRLDKIAKEMDALAPTGSRANRPSWRTLIRQLADGQIEVTKGDSQDEPIRN